MFRSPIKSLLHSTPSVSILSVLFALISIGLLMIYSASTFYAEQTMGSKYYFISRQIIHFFIGLIALRIAIVFPYKRYKAIIGPLMVLSFILMVLVLIPGIGRQVGHARRWIRFLGFGFQPSELLKIVMIIWVAFFLERKKDVLIHFSKGVLPSLSVVGGFCFLLVLQPDFGTAVLIVFTLLIMIFTAGVRPIHMIGSLSGMAVIGVYLVSSRAYRMRRITGFLDPWADPLDSGFQLIQSLIAFGTGGVFGQDLGNSQQKLFFLPESHTDFIFSILAEETGFIGVLVVLALIVILMLKGFSVALETGDEFGKNLSFGITIIIVLQSIFNIAVVSGLLPTKGIPLPFISYGGSSLIINMYMVGIIVNIANSQSLSKQK